MRIKACDRFVYDSFGNTSSIGAGDNTLATYTYNGNKGKLKSITYGNGLIEEYVYNDLDMISEIWYTKICINPVDPWAWAF